MSERAPTTGKGATRRRFVCSWLVWITLGGWVWSGTTAVAEESGDWRALVASGQLVDLRKYDPSIVVDLRYATVRNCVGQAIYPADFPCLTRPETAVRLRIVQGLLHQWGYRLKIWDAYRPATAQAILYKRWAGQGFVANPDVGPGSFHAWGLAVDATMVDLVGREVSMPSDFDVFAPTVGAIYLGVDKKVAFHLHLLQAAMGTAGFMGLRNEWWHFVTKDWHDREPLALPGAKAGTPPPKPADAPDLVTAPGTVGKPGNAARAGKTPP